VRDGKASRNRIRTGQVDCTWAGLERAVLPRKAAVAADDHTQAILAVNAHLDDPGELLVASVARFDDVIVDELRAAGFSIVRGLGTDEAHVEEPSVEGQADPGCIWLLTSGSTGRPKRVRHSLAGLTTVTAQQPDRTWLCAYSPGSYAWWQVISLGLAHAGTGVVCVEVDELDGWPRLARETGVTAVSGTPTFWRHAIWRDAQEVAAIPLVQATLGGEPVDQALLDSLRRLHPEARVSWIYASSEAGSAIAVHDGMAGFPQAWLDQEIPGRPRLSVINGELVLNSPFASSGNATNFRTGDRVKISGGRVRITGRIGWDEINVGGSKVSAAEVREVLLRHPAVAWAAVRGRRAPIVGQVVVGDVVLSSEADEATLRNWCVRSLADYAVPRRIAILSEIPLNESMKSDV